MRGRGAGLPGDLGAGDGRPAHGGSPAGGGQRSVEALLEGMSAWAGGFIPADLSFDVSMRRRVLARVPGVLARESRRRLMGVLRAAAVAAVVLIAAGGAAFDLRAQVPPVVYAEDGQAGALPAGEAGGGGRSAWSTRQEAAALPPGAGEAAAPAGAVSPPGAAGAGAGEGKEPSAPQEAVRVRFLPVLVAAAPEPAAEASTMAVAAAPEPAVEASAMAAGAAATGGPAAAGEEEVAAGQAAAAAGPVTLARSAEAALTAQVDGVRETALDEALAYAGTVSGQPVVVTVTGRAWRYVEGRLVGGENLFPAGAASGRMVLLPEGEAARVLWVDGQGTLRLGEGAAPVGLSGRVKRLAWAPGGTAPAVVAAASVEEAGGYRVVLWTLEWERGSLRAEELGGAPGEGTVEPEVPDLAAFFGDRGLTVYLTVASPAASEGRSYLGELREGRLRWRPLPGPLFRSGTAVASSAGLMAGVGQDGGVALLEWVPEGGVRAWFRPGGYLLRQVSFPEMGGALKSVHFFDPEGGGREGLLVVGESGRVGYVDPALVALR